jgi:hypothetical protein
VLFAGIVTAWVVSVQVLALANIEQVSAVFVPFTLTV